MAKGISGLTNGASNVYSSLLSSLGDSNDIGNTTLLSDYAAIKNGSYTKMMKAYYAQKSDETGATSESSSSKAKETVKDSKTATAASALYSAAEALSNAEFSEDNKDEIYEKASDFVKKYNTMLSAASNSEIKDVFNQGTYMVSTTSAQSKSLSYIGITMKEDGTLSIDETKFKKADIGSLKSLFMGTGSFADAVSSRATKVYRYANGGTSLSTKTYTSSGSYDNTAADNTVLDTTT